MTLFQTVTVDDSFLKFKPGDVFTLPLIYNTSGSDANLSGLTLNVHYNSSVLTPSGSSNGVSAQLSAAITSTVTVSYTHLTLPTKRIV